jgi:Mor family transcriptional regulator
MGWLRAISNWIGGDSELLTKPASLLGRTRNAAFQEVHDGSERDEDTRKNGMSMSLPRAVLKRLS